MKEPDVASEYARTILDGNRKGIDNTMVTEDRVTLDSRSPYFTDNIVASVKQ